LYCRDAGWSARDGLAIVDGFLRGSGVRADRADRSWRPDRRVLAAAAPGRTPLYVGVVGASGLALLVKERCCSRLVPCWRGAGAEPGVLRRSARGGGGVLVWRLPLWPRSAARLVVGVAAHSLDGWPASCR